MGRRLVFQLGYQQAAAALEAWIGQARHCRIPSFVDPQRRLLKHQRLDGRVEIGQWGCWDGQGADVREVDFLCGTGS